MGRDKFENEELIRWGFPEDVWFHVDNLSSAHVYLRPKQLSHSVSYDSIPEDVLEECCQLVKQNSIEGCKLGQVQVVWTPWANLKKTRGMDVGQVGFHDDRQVRRRRVERNREIAKRLMKAKIEKNDVNFADLRLARDRHERRKINEAKLAQKREDERARADAIQRQQEREYVDLMRPELMTSNRESQMSAQEYEDNFM
eukprot:gnl/Trimastix_PCT/2375.p1 GENE.gnl/Trimastix_PCT/2375~~gnl/Trimastix_PCT/2375.p1  ORF type:complete len:228 (+),score=63.37 gnl/Trimastix_PCT/2375:90-686(+)